MAVAKIKKTDTLGSVIEDYPEVAPVLASAGLHCIGCHVSAYESIEQGCLAHGMSKKDVDDMVKAANKRILEYEGMPKVSFTPKAVVKLAERKGKKKFVRITQVFGGELDFEAVEKKGKGDALVVAGKWKEGIPTVSLPRIMRMLRGVRIDYDAKKKDFVAKRV